MAPLRTLALLTLASFAIAGAAHATPLKNDSRQAVTAASDQQIADAIIIEPRARTQVSTEVVRAKPKIWISMGFGF